MHLSDINIVLPFARIPMMLIDQIFYIIMFKNFFGYGHTHANVGTNLATDTITMTTIIFLTDEISTKRASVVRMLAKGGSTMSTLAIGALAKGVMTTGASVKSTLVKGTSTESNLVRGTPTMSTLAKGVSTKGTSVANTILAIDKTSVAHRSLTKASMMDRASTMSNISMVTDIATAMDVATMTDIQ